jgi:amino acid adenylation domain-containing protein
MNDVAATMAGKTLDDVLAGSAERFPDKTALVVGTTRISYAELDRAANGVAVGLRVLGVVAGDRVAVCLDNGIEGVVSYFGALKAGAMVMLVNHSTKGDKLKALIDDAEASALIIDAAKADTVAVITTAVSLRSVVLVGEGPDLAGLNEQFNDRVGHFETLMTSGSDTPPPRHHSADDVAMLLYTSGSTGKPKGVMLLHHGMVSVVGQINDYLHTRHDDVVLQVLPLSFGYGLTQLLTCFAVGATLVLERSFAFPQVIWKKIAAEKVTCFSMVPTIATILAQADLGPHDFSSLRLLTNAGAALPTELLRVIAAKLPRTSIYPMYGQTECVRASYLPPTEVHTRPASVGRGIPGQDHWLVDDDGNILPPGSTGQLVVRGPHVMLGYWRMPEVTAKKILPGRHPRERVLLTGDLFSMDQEGWLTFVSRMDDIIKTRGEKVSPKEVENVLYAVDHVAEAAVIGVPDPILGQAVWAFVAAKPGMTLDPKAVQRQCAAQLEDFAVPRMVMVVDELPKTPNAKIDKQALRERHAVNPIVPTSIPRSLHAHHS